MGRPRKAQSMSDGKKEIIARLIDEYDIKSAADIQDALRDLLGETIQGMMESEMGTSRRRFAPTMVPLRYRYRRIETAITSLRSCLNTAVTSRKLTRRSSKCTHAA